MERRSFLKALLGFPVVAAIPSFAVSEEAWVLGDGGLVIFDEVTTFIPNTAWYAFVGSKISTSTSAHVWETFVL